jgi:hypothetical protein
MDMPTLRSWFAFALLALPALAGQRRQSFQVGAVVVRSALIRSEIGPQGASRLKLAGAPALWVQIDSAPARLVRGDEVALPEGVTRVTIQY